MHSSMQPMHAPKFPYCVAFDRAHRDNGETTETTARPQLLNPTNKVVNDVTIQNTIGLIKLYCSIVSQWLNIERCDQLANIPSYNPLGKY